jgi:hypothetical protein
MRSYDLQEEAIRACILHVDPKALYYRFYMAFVTWITVHVLY